MKNFEKSLRLLNLVLLFLPFSGYSQVLYEVGIEKDSGLNSDRIFLSDSSSIILPGRKPFYSFSLNNKPYHSGEVNAVKINDLYSQTFKNNLWVTCKTSKHTSFGWRGELTFENKSNDTVSI